MRLGAPAIVGPPRGTVAMRGVALLLVLLGPAAAGDTPSLQEFLGRTQTQTERKAVEDLIGKLQGGARKVPPPPVSAPGAPVAVPPSAASAPAARPAEPPASAASHPPAAPPSATVAAPPATAPQESVSAPGDPAAAAAATASAPTAKPAGEPASTAPPVPPPAPPEATVASPPTTMAPQAAVESAERKERPSVDLEVFFAYKAAQITPQAATVLATLGRALADPRLAGDAFLIAGHTDAKGSDDYNLALSEKRAEAVRQFLIDSFKISPDRLVAKGFGRQRLKNPKAPLADENRRVQIVIMSK
jgi:outer membrane protein OmpA-like peptidoglycan-associated protein